MKKFHPFFAIGTLGMIIISLFHIFFSLSLNLTAAHTTFYTIYSLFATIVVLGVAFTVKQQKQHSVLGK